MRMVIAHFKESERDRAGKNFILLIFTCMIHGKVTPLIFVLQTNAQLGHLIFKTE